MEIQQRGIMFNWWVWNWAEGWWDEHWGEMRHLDPEWRWNHPKREITRCGGQEVKRDKKPHARIRKLENQLMDEQWIQEVEVRVWRE